MARRCPPDQDQCTATIEANLVGIGGVQEPRTVILMIATDKKDQNLQIVRMVCTWPIKERKACRDWNTGKLILASDAGGDQLPRQRQPPPFQSLQAYRLLGAHQEIAMKRANVVPVLLLAMSVTILMTAQTTALKMMGMFDTSCGSWTQAREIH